MATVTEKEIQDWKQKHGDVFTVTCEDEGGNPVVGYFRKPDRQILNYISTLASQPFRMQEQMVVKCWLGGDTIILTNDQYLMGAAQTINELLEVKQFELKKL